MLFSIFIIFIVIIFYDDMFRDADIPSFSLLSEVAVVSVVAPS